MFGVHGSDVLAMAFNSIRTFILNPLVYVALAMMLWEHARLANQERKFFGVRVSQDLRPVLRRCVEGLGIGIGMSLLSILLGVHITAWQVAVVSILSIVLGVLQVRFLATYHAVGVLALITFVLRYWDGKTGVSVVDTLCVNLRNTDLVSWLMLASLAFLGEGILLRLHQQDMGTPVYLMSKRGRAIGALAVQLSFLIPIVSWAPGNVSVASPVGAGWPWMGHFDGGVTWVAFPLIVGFSGVFTTMTSPASVYRISWTALAAGLFVALDACAVHWMGTGFAGAGILVCFLAKGVVNWRLKRLEQTHEPIYTETGAGVRVLGTLRGSLSEAMGLKPGEIITHVNQVPVHSTYDLHFAFDQNPAYAKLSVLDNRGELRMVGKAVYAGEKNKLGLILVPEHAHSVCLTRVNNGLFHLTFAKSEGGLGRLAQQDLDAGEISPSQT